MTEAGTRIGRETEFYTIRLWQERLTPERMEWRGKISHVLSGRTRYFHDWETLLDFLQADVAATAGSEQPGTTP